MPTTLDQINLAAIEIINRYKHVPFHGRTIETPYYVNSIENIYRVAMRDAGIPKELVDKTFSAIRQNKTPLHGKSGKGTPQEIAEDLQRLYEYQLTRNKDLSTMPDNLIRAFMKRYQLGIDCSGLVYNALKHAVPNQEENFSQLLSWKDPNIQTATQASCKVFDSPKLITVPSLESAQALDLVIFRHNRHMGILVSRGDELFLVDSSIETDCVDFYKVDKDHGLVDRRPVWEKGFKENEVYIKRLPLLK